MGYCASSYEVNMHFPAHVLENAHTALVEHCKNAQDGSCWTSDIANTPNLKEALEMLLFEVTANEDGSLTVDYRQDEKVPMHMNDYFSALAPFVHSEPTKDKPATQGGYIIWHGEDNAYWRDSCQLLRPQGAQLGHGYRSTSSTPIHTGD